MLNLASTTDKLQIISSVATPQLDVHVSYVDDTTSTSNMTPGKQNTQVSTTVTTDITASPASGDIRNIKFISVRNTHASTRTNATIQYNANGTLYTLALATLLAGEHLVCREGIWFHFDRNMGVYSVGQTFAVQRDMETGTSLTLVVSPGNIKWHPSRVKAWVSCGVAADIQQSYNIASLTDTGTGVVTITFTTAQRAATYCAGVSVEATGTTWAVANSRECHIRSATRATGSYACDCIDNTVTTNLVKDPTTWHSWVFGDFA